MNSTPDLPKAGPARRVLWVAGLTAAAALGLAPLSFHMERRLDTAVRLEGSESDYVAQQLATRFCSPFVDLVVPVIQGLPPADSDDGTQALTTMVDAMKGPDVAGIVSRLDPSRNLWRLSHRAHHGLCERVWIEHGLRILVARVLEARRSGLSETEAITEGLARTAGLITSAAALIDATLVRIVIGPALLSLAGEWIWWPGGLAGANARVAPERIR
jgi:hypothetical protein